MRTASGKPAFVFNHFQLKDKFVSHWPGSDVGPQGEQLDSILKNCGTKVFYFSGHLHMGVYENGNGLAQEGNVTYINVPGFGEECLYGDIVDRGMAGKWRFTTARSCFACATSPTANG